MCGFLAEFLTNNSGALTEVSEFENLLALSKHRGPDSTLNARGDNFQLGFNRLAIIDLSTNGNQPKTSGSGRYHVVFNGEIYNFKELAQQYSLTKQKPSSDTEVLCLLLDAIGIEDTIKQLNGMFAIAIVDLKTTSFILVRDFAGIKPLFYGISKKGIVAASQFDQIFKHPFLKDNLELRPSIMKEYFGFGYMQAPNTIYKDIFQVSPGEMLSWDASGRLSKLRYNLYDQSSDNSFFSNQTKTLSRTITHAVERQLVSDVPLASFLSGGIDSPLITAIAKEFKPDINAYTIAVSDPDMNEANEATAYAAHLNCNHKIVDITTESLLQSIDAHFRLLPEPFGDYSSIPTFNITKEAKRHFTVMLSGDGGDELYHGYPRMLDIMSYRPWFRIPFVLRKPLYRLAKKLKNYDSWGPYNFKTISDWVINKHRYILEESLDSFFPATGLSKEMKDLYCYRKKGNLLDYLRYNEFYGHLQRVLVKVDRMSMANSLEVRVPFLDKDNLNASFSMHPERFRTTKDLKAPLKALMSQHYPESIIFKKKKGFTVPMNNWLRGELKDDVRKLILDTPFYGGELINITAVEQYVEDFYDRKHDSEWGVWHIYAWQKWAINHDMIKRV